MANIVFNGSIIYDPPVTPRELSLLLQTNVTNGFSTSADYSPLGINTEINFEITIIGKHANNNVDIAEQKIDFILSSNNLGSVVSQAQFPLPPNSVGNGALWTMNALAAGPLLQVFLNSAAIPDIVNWVVKFTPLGVKTFP